MSISFNITRNAFHWHINSFARYHSILLSHITSQYSKYGYTGVKYNETSSDLVKLFETLRTKPILLETLLIIVLIWLSPVKVSLLITTKTFVIVTCV